MNSFLKLLVLSLFTSTAAFATAEVSMAPLDKFLDMSKPQIHDCSYLEDGSWLGIKTTYTPKSDKRVHDMQVTTIGGDPFKKGAGFGQMLFTVDGWVGQLSFEPSESKNAICKMVLQKNRSDKSISGKIDCAMVISDESKRSGDDHATNTNVFIDPYQEPDGRKPFRLTMNLKHCKRIEK